MKKKKARAALSDRVGESRRGSGKKTYRSKKMWGGTRAGEGQGRKKLEFQEDGGEKKETTNSMSFGKHGGGPPN